jgi:hypothetical protein
MVRIKFSSRPHVSAVSPSASPMALKDAANVSTEHREPSTEVTSNIAHFSGEVVPAHSQ